MKCGKFGITSPIICISVVITDEVNVSFLTPLKLQVLRLTIYQFDRFRWKSECHTAALFMLTTYIFIHTTTTIHQYNFRQIQLYLQQFHGHIFCTLLCSVITTSKHYLSTLSHYTTPMLNVCGCVCFITVCPTIK